MKKTEICALGAGLSFLLGAGAVETMPVITILMIAAMAACVKIGRLWEADNEK